MPEDGLRSFAGAVALITGGASGLGRALGEGLAQRGAEVVLADRQIDLAREVADAIVATGGRARAVELDVRRAEDFQQVVGEVAERSGRIDFLFNNAGIAIIGEVRDYDFDDWHQVVDVNLNGVYYGIRAVYPILLRQGYGHIINTASTAGLIPTPMAGSYCATKHAVVGLSSVLRIEAARHGVRVSALCPGPVRTPILTGGAFGRVLYGIEREKVLHWWEKLRPIDPPEFARQTLKAVAKNEGVIVVPRRLKPIVALTRLSSRLSLWLMSLGHRDTMNSFPEIDANQPRRPGV